MIKLYEQIKEEYTNLCLGIDPSDATLKSLELGCDYTGLYEFSHRLVDIYKSSVGIVKPQTAFFEQYGSIGIKLLEEIVKELRSYGKIVIVDSKRGDIGSSNDGYAKAYLQKGSPLECDALTVVSYFGFDALLPIFDMARVNDKVVFIVVASSNSEGIKFQNSQYSEGVNLSTHLAEEIVKYNTKYNSSSLGSVVGATRSDARTIISILKNSFILMPGIGAQGATFSDIKDLTSNYSCEAIPNVSRAVTYGSFDNFNITNNIKNLIKNYKGNIWKKLLHW